MDRCDVVWWGRGREGRGQQVTQYNTCAIHHLRDPRTWLSPGSTRDSSSGIHGRLQVRPGNYVTCLIYYFTYLFFLIGYLFSLLVIYSFSFYHYLFIYVFLSILSFFFPCLYSCCVGYCFASPSSVLLIIYILKELFCIFPLFSPPFFSSSFTFVWCTVLSFLLSFPLFLFSLSLYTLVNHLSIHSLIHLHIFLLPLLFIFLLMSYN